MNTEAIRLTDEEDNSYFLLTASVYAFLWLIPFILLDFAPYVHAKETIQHGLFTQKSDRPTYYYTT